MLQSSVLIILGLIVMFMPVTDAIFLLVRSPLVAIGFGSSQQLVGSGVSSSYGGEG